MSDTMSNNCLTMHGGLDDVFFELIRVAIGTQGTLSRLPSVGEWGELYKMAKKQSLVGICFAGLQRLGADADEGFERIGMSEKLYLTWMGMAVKIQQRNEKVDRQCVELQMRLAKDGFRSCILKGQGVARLYKVNDILNDNPNHNIDLSGLRQSGDIDVWVDASKEKVVTWAEKYGVTECANYLHVGVRCFENTEVELHFRPTYMRSLRHNWRLQRFCEEHKCDWVNRNGIIVPAWEFDMVYQLSHIYRHLFGLGVGLRQLMDYYFLLKNTISHGFPKNFSLILSRLGLLDFSGAVMYVMREVFRLDEKYMICPMDEKRGRMLLDMVLQTGNFGKMDNEQQEARSTGFGSLVYKVKQWGQLVRLYPEETLSAPVWSIFFMMIEK